MSENFLTTEELAKKTGFTKRFWEARRLSKSKDESPPFIRLGCHAVRYRWDDVSKWLEDRIVDTSKEKLDD